MDVLMGGRAAEEILLGPEHVTTGASNDLEVGVMYRLVYWEGEAGNEPYLVLVLCCRLCLVIASVIVRTSCE